MAGSESANVHNIYRLVAAETGYLGLVTFVVLLVRPLISAIRCGRRNPGDDRVRLRFGFGVALLTVYLHSFFEWVFIAFQAQYMFAMEMGLVAGLAGQLGYWGRRQPQGVRYGIDAFPIRPTRHAR
jgi:O-antigen ligase